MSGERSGGIITMKKVVEMSGAIITFKKVGEKSEQIVTFTTSITLRNLVHRRFVMAVSHPGWMDCGPAGDTAGGYAQRRQSSQETVAG